MPTKISGGTAHTLPADMKAVLTADPELLEIWEDLTPLARNEWICWTISVKKPETRQKHLDRLQSDMKSGHRRPCCWYGCIHRQDKKVSPSVKNLVLKKK